MKARYPLEATIPLHFPSRLDLLSTTSYSSLLFFSCPNRSEEGVFYTSLSVCLFVSLFVFLFFYLAVQFVSLLRKL